ncbi:hypothetical protein [Micromonospora sp. CA-246542]
MSPPHVEPSVIKTPVAESALTPTRNSHGASVNSSVNRATIIVVGAARN